MTAVTKLNCADHAFHSTIPRKVVVGARGMAHPIGTRVRHIILHHHVFRNGGTVLERILDKNFADGFALLNSQDHDRTITHADLLLFLREHPDVRAVSSYHVRPPGPEVLDFVFFDLIFLRHPLDRICVIFDSYQRDTSAEALATLARNTDLGTFVEQLMSSYPHFVNDAQVNYLANGGRYCRPPNTSDLQKAVQIMKHAALPGLTHLFDISLTTAEYYFFPAFPHIDFSYIAANSPSAPASYQSRLDRLRGGCKPSTYERLVEMNHLDLELIQTVEKEIYRRFQLIPNSEQKAANFLERCKQASEYFLEWDNVDS